VRLPSDLTKEDFVAIACWKAAQLGNVIANKGFYQAAFHSRIAEKLMEAGHRLRRTERDFEMDVFTHEEIRANSGRSRARGLRATRDRRMPSITCCVLVTS
jgi:hypothetical protein